MLKQRIRALFGFSLLPIAAPTVHADILYLTDLEGSRPRFEEFMRSSGAFSLGEDGRFHLNDEVSFVFGGDAPDRYLGSRWVVAELVRLKEENPDRVTLILGNRDINKMRLTSELSALALQLPPVQFPSTSLEEWKKHVHPESAPERLKFILAQTMGAPKAFELRRQELASEAFLSPAEVSDEDVTQSFLNELGEGGRFRSLLELGQLAHRIGNTLFVHGGITKANLGFVPGSRRHFDNVDEWIERLNAWMQEGLDIWRRQGQNWSGESPRAEEAWLDYVRSNPGQNSKPESVITGRYTDANNNPLLPDEEAIRNLLSQGIHRLVIGHTPTGDFPVILRTEDENFEVISADNSLSNESFASVVRLGGDHYSRTQVDGHIQHDGKVLKVNADLRIGQPSPIGKRFNGGILLGRLRPNRDQLIQFHYEEKFKKVTKLVSESEINSAVCADAFAEQDSAKAYSRPVDE